MSAGAEQDTRAGSISLADEDTVKPEITESILGLWDVFNGLTRLRPSRRERCRVTIFGAERVEPGQFAYEETMIWQLLQVRHLTDTPLILVGRMWPGLVEWVRASMLSADPPLASPEDMSIPRCVASGDEAIAVLREHHDRWRRAQTD